MDSTPQNNLFGQYQPTPIKGAQLPLFHQPVDAPLPNRDTPTDALIRLKFAGTQTGELFGADDERIRE
ncbi:MAG TPA: hypothetical protein VG269_15845 [Tepidisphaeraceae bacterium]|jgi:hypothetical protein|nr:hypothetical protein [Tepidisphaeraceae bacterium]